MFIKRNIYNMVFLNNICFFLFSIIEIYQFAFQSMYIWLPKRKCQLLVLPLLLYTELFEFCYCACAFVRLSATCLQPLWDNRYVGRSSAPGSFRPLWSAPCKSTTWNYRSSVDFSSLQPLNNVCWKF